MKIIFSGGPGTGKSTVGKRLAGDLKWQWISTGEILRSSTEPWVQERLKTAELFSDEMMADLVFPRLEENENVVLDGFPRTLRQAELMVERKMLADLIVEIDVPQEEAMVRMLARGREQDTKEVIEERWAEYSERQSEIIAYLVGNGVQMISIDGMGEPDEVYKRAVNKIVAVVKEKENKKETKKDKSVTEKDDK